jgi:hypothetical protein
MREYTMVGCCSLLFVVAIRERESHCVWQYFSPCVCMCVTCCTGCLFLTDEIEIG